MPPSDRWTFLIPSMSGGGAERQMSYLVNHVARSQRQCTLLTLAPTSNGDYPIAPTVKRIGLDLLEESQGLLNAVRANRRRIAIIRKAILASEPTSVISFCDRMNILTLAALRNTDIPVIICERSDPRNQRLGWIWEGLRRFYYPSCHSCVVQTASVRDYLQPIVGKRKNIHVIPTAFQPRGEISKETDESNSVKRLLFVGRLSHEKGIDRLLDIWLTLTAEFPDWRLAIAGEGPVRERWQSIHNDNPLAKAIEWLGWSSDIQSVMNRCDAFVLPSRYEGFPNALLEAMDCGLPCIATDCSASIREIITPNETGLVVSNDVTGLEVGIQQLLSDPVLRTRIAERATSSVAKFSWPIVSKQWEEVLGIESQQSSINPFDGSYSGPNSQTFT